MPLQNVQTAHFLLDIQ